MDLLAQVPRGTEARARTRERGGGSMGRRSRSHPAGQHVARAGEDRETRARAGPARTTWRHRGRARWAGDAGEGGGRSVGVHAVKAAAAKGEDLMA